MTTQITPSQHHSHEVEMQQINDRTIFGFWMYLMTDCVIFATFFAAYAVLHFNTAGGPSGQDIFNLPYALHETLILLTSTFTCGLAMMAAHKQQKFPCLALFFVTLLLGLSFLTLEFREFSHLVQEGNSWRRSAFLTSYFSLVGCHGLHVTCGSLWMIVMLGHISFRGLTESTLRRLTCLSLFWHFLDVIWVLIFTIVYLMGVK